MALEYPTMKPALVGFLFALCAVFFISDAVTIGTRIDYTFSDLQVARFREAFKVFDKDGTGKISKADICGVMKSLGRQTTEAEIQSLIEFVRKENEQMIDFTEFLQLMQESIRRADIESLKQAFRLYDKDEDGFISWKELQVFMGRFGELVTEQEAKDMIRTIDTDGDGMIDLKDFVLALSPEHWDY